MSEDKLLPKACSRLDQEEVRASERSPEGQREVIDHLIWTSGGERIAGTPTTALAEQLKQWSVN